MESVHCNMCFHFPNFFPDRRRYFICSCGHVLCEGCKCKIKNDQCLLCSMKTRTIEVNSETKPEVKAYFCDPLKEIQDFSKKLEGICTFQKKQLKSSLGHLKFQIELTENLKTENKKLQIMYENVLNEKENLKKRLEEIERTEQPWIRTLSNSCSPANNLFIQEGIPKPINSGVTPIATFFQNWTHEMQEKKEGGAGSIRSSCSVSSTSSNRNPEEKSLRDAPTGVASPFSPSIMRQRNDSIGERRPQSGQLGGTPDLVSRLRSMRCSRRMEDSRAPPSHFYSRFQ